MSDSPGLPLTAFEVHKPETAGDEVHQAAA